MSTSMVTQAAGSLLAGQDNSLAVVDNTSDVLKHGGYNAVKELGPQQKQKFSMATPAEPRGEKYLFFFANFVWRKTFRTMPVKYC